MNNRIENLIKEYEEKVKETVKEVKIELKNEIDWKELRPLFVSVEKRLLNKKISIYRKVIKDLKRILMEK